jgi:hypothetical protein
MIGQQTDWDIHKGIPDCSTHEKGKTLMSKLHTFRWIASVIVSRLNQMHDEQPTHWVFTPHKPPIGNMSSLGAAANIWREGLEKPF